MYYTLLANLCSFFYFLFMLGSSKDFKGSNLSKAEFMLNLRKDGGGPSKYTTPKCDWHWAHSHRL